MRHTANAAAPAAVPSAAEEGRGTRSKASLRQALIKVRSILDEHVAAVDRDLASLVSQITNELRPEGEGSPPPKAQKK